MRINLSNVFIGVPFIHGRYYSHDWEYLMSQYRSIVKEHMTAVEVGSSTVQKTRDLARYCKKVIGVEINEENINDAIPDVEVLHGDWQNLSTIFAPGSVDIVVSSHVIEHVPDDLRALNETYEVLREGGSLFLITPNRNRLSRSMARLIGVERFMLYKEHVREYTEEDLKDLLRRSRFTQYSIKGIVLGLHSGRFMCYLKHCPGAFKQYANFWEVHLRK